MSPRFELNFFMNPMGFGFGGGMPFSPFCSGFGMGSFMPSLFCGSNFMTMPYSDTLTFMNTPIFRNTSYDYLLDPNLALRQCQQNWAMGGGYFSGSTMLPGWQFPQVQWPGIQLPGVTKPESAEEKKAREEKEKAKAEDEKKPEHTKAKNLEKLFNEIKKIAADENNDLTPITKEQEDAVKEAMKKEKAEDRYEAMKKVFEGIDVSTIRKAMLNNESIRKDLRKAGYNFDKSDNTIKNPDIKEQDFDNKDMVEKLHDCIKEGTDYTVLQSFSAQANVKGGNILSFISAWNDKYNSDNEKGILRYIAANLPDNESNIKIVTPSALAISSITRGLLKKAEEYKDRGCTQIDNSIKTIEKELKQIIRGNDDAKFANYQNAKNDINKLANECDKLYIQLRMLEAEKVRNSINKNEEFKFLNNVKEGVIDNNLIVAETIQDLKAEKFAEADIPKVSELPKPKKTEAEAAAARRKANREWNDMDTAEKKLKFLTEQDPPLLTQISENSDVYKTAGLDENDKDARYYKIIDDKLVEVVKRGDNFEQIYEVDDDSDVKDEIYNYTDAITRAKDLISSNAIVDYRTSDDLKIYPIKYPVFKATGANQFFIIKDNKLCEIKDCTGIQAVTEKGDDGINEVTFKAIGPNKTLDELTEDNLNSEFTNDDIKSQEKIRKDKEKETEAEKVKRANKITQNEYVWRNMKSQLDSLGLEETGVIGYYKTKAQPVLYFRYNDNSKDKNFKHLTYLKNVTEIDKDGTMTIKGNKLKKYCQEVQTVEDGAKELYKVLNTIAYKYDNYLTYKTKEEVQKDLLTIKRKLNSFIARRSVKDIVDFIKIYQNKTEHWWKENDKSLCFAIASNKIIPEADKKKYIKAIANYIQQIVDKKGIVFDNSDDNVILKNIAAGDLVTSSSEGTDAPTSKSICTTAVELNRIIKLFLEKYDALSYKS